MPQIALWSLNPKLYTLPASLYLPSAVVAFQAPNLFGCPHSQGLGLGGFRAAALGQKVADGIRLHKLEHISPKNGAQVSAQNKMH